jgi:hypothetical protein
MIRVTRETHEAPDSIQERVARAGGVNRFGEANFRVVWGGSRLGWIAGKWVDRDASGNVIRECIEARLVPKYLPMDRWHIEKWMPPETYGSREEWYARTEEVEDGVRVAALGPYPSRGEYEHCFTLEDGEGEFLPLTPAVCDGLILAVEWARMQPRSAGRGALAAREMRREREWDRAADDLFDDSAPAFHGAEFVSL